MMNDERILLKGGRIVADGASRVADIMVGGGVITDIAPELEADGCRVIDVSGCMVCSGLVDVHVHLREPGYSYKETILTGSLAAAHGGYTTVCTMPNLNPAPDSLDTLRLQQDIIDRDAAIDVRPYATITMGRKGREVVDVDSLKDKVCGFSDDGSGVQQDDVMLAAMQAVAAADSIIAAHCEDNALLHGGYIHDGRYAREHNHRGICSESEWGPIKRDVEMAARTGCRYHVCHVSSAESVEIIRQAKQRGVKVSCETAPHYLSLCEDDLQEDGRFKMNPPLRSAADRDALIRGIQDGTIEVIATDHAPHSDEEKSRGLEKSAMGIVGLETAFAAVYTHLVAKGIIDEAGLVALMSENPRRIFRLGGGLHKGEKADIAVFDTETEWTVNPNGFLSMGHATPYAGDTLQGRCVLTLCGGRTAWAEHKYDNK